MSVAAVPSHQRNLPMAAKTAFTPVSARRTLAHSQPSPVSSSNLPPVKQKVWPQPVRDYVQRSFAPESRIPGVEFAEMEAKLKSVITEAAETNSMDNIDWATLPLPQQLIQQERAMAATWGSQNATDVPWDVPESNNFGTAKKRKVDDDDLLATNSAPAPSWRPGDKQQGFADRVTYANPTQAKRVEKRAKKQQEALGALGHGTSKYSQAIEKRKQRFGAQAGSSPPWNAARSGSPAKEEPTGPVVGTCQRLEKNYFRLNAYAPNPEEVRPLEVLEKTLVLLKNKWKAESNYVYICDQFKSMRQDLTVQHIKNSFTIEVYELHARIALEWKDLGEYNQCQTQLRALYSLNLGGHPAEFLAYRILYFIFTGNRTGLNDVLADLTPELKQQHSLRHALAMRSALASGNYHKFFHLYLEVPNMGAYLVDQFVTRERLAALASICRAYKPNVSIKFLTEELGFESYMEAFEFLTEHLTKPGIPTNAVDAIDREKFLLDTTKVAQIFEGAKAAAFKSVDIKGQI